MCRATACASEQLASVVALPLQILFSHLHHFPVPACHLAALSDCSSFTVERNVDEKCVCRPTQVYCEGIAQCRSKVHGALKDTQVLVDGRDSRLRSLEKEDRETLDG